MKRKQLSIMRGTSFKMASRNECRVDGERLISGKVLRRLLFRVSISARASVR